MKEIAIFGILFLILNISFAEICCQEFCCDVGGCEPPKYNLKDKCFANPPCYSYEVDMSKCSSQNTQPTQTSPSGEKLTPGEIIVTWTPVQISVCPPGIFGTVPCTYPSLIDLVKRINELLRTIAPPLLVILLIIGGLMYLLSPFGVENYIQRGHKYIKYAVIGYIILLLVTLIFTIISALFGGPSP